jgi:hypothetical protein
MNTLLRDDPPPAPVFLPPRPSPAAPLSCNNVNPYHVAIGHLQLRAQTGQLCNLNGVSVTFLGDTPCLWRPPADIDLGGNCWILIVSTAIQQIFSFWRVFIRVEQLDEPTSAATCIYETPSYDFQTEPTSGLVWRLQDINTNTFEIVDAGFVTVHKVDDL